MAERDWQNSGNQTQQSLTGDSGHPFLTQRGLWLQQNSRVDLPQGIALPSNFPGGSGAGGSSDIPVSGSWIKTETDPNSKEPPLLGRFRDEPLNEGSLQNLQPAEHFPDVASLRRGPLTQHYASALASDRIWDDRSTLPLSPSITPKELNQANRAFAHAARAIGKMVIRLAGKPASQFASGSAFVTGPNTIMTCAHNLFDSNERQWSAGLEFYPNYDFYSNEPRPACRIVSGIIPRAYLDNPLSNHDIAVCRVDQNIGDLIGAELPPMELNDIGFFDRNIVDVMGYPAGSGFDFGKQLWRSRGRFLFGVRGGVDDDFSPAVATNFGGGASGCPWVHYDRNRQQAVAVGITSGHARLRYDPAEPNLMSLTSSLFSSRTLGRLNDDYIEHSF